MSLTQTIIEERLQPVVRPPPQSMNQGPKQISLIRSSSFDRLKHLPSSLHAYFCRHGSIEVIKWLVYSRIKIYTTLSQIQSQLRSLLLISSVYAAVGLISIQLGICLYLLGTTSLPAGFTFLLACILAIVAIAVKINFSTIPVSHRPSRPRRRHIKND